MKLINLMSLLQISVAFLKNSLIHYKIVNKSKLSYNFIKNELFINNIINYNFSNYNNTINLNENWDDGEIPWDVDHLLPSNKFEKK